MMLVLIGYRGTGKSTVGKRLASHLGLRYLSMDKEIEKRAELTIPQIVERFGWDRFRDLESALARELGDSDDLVLDTGGGVVERPENLPSLKAKAKVIWLKASTETVVARISHGTHRPALTAGKSFTEEVAEILERRTPLYRAAAHYEVDTDDRTPLQVVEEILKLLGR
jgi:shikimate kinase